MKVYVRHGLFVQEAVIQIHGTKPVPVKRSASLKVSECDDTSRGRSQWTTGTIEGVLKLEEVVVHELPYAWRIDGAG